MSGAPAAKRLKQTKLSFPFAMLPAAAAQEQEQEPVPSLNDEAGTAELDLADFAPPLDPAPAVETEGCNFDCCNLENTQLPPNRPNVDRSSTIRSYGSGDRERDRYFATSWYNGRDWLVLCKTRKRAFCHVCRLALKHNLITFSKLGENEYVSAGFNNWKKCPKRLDDHEQSQFHREASIKLAGWLGTRINDKMKAQKETGQESNKKALVKVYECVQLLARQGLAFRRRDEQDSNLSMVLKLLSKRDPSLAAYLSNNKYLSHDIINELVECLYRHCFSKLLESVKAAGFFAIIVDETTDCSKKEQLSFCIRYVEHGEVHEDFVGLYDCPNTDSSSIFSVICDILLRCDLKISNVRGQTYDGASNLQGRINGVAARIRSIEPKAVSIHCLNHCLNLILQEVGQNNVLIRNAISLAQALHEIISASAKRLAIFEGLTNDDGESAISVDCQKRLKPLCPTRWACRTGALESILSNYRRVIMCLENIVDQGGTTEAVKRSPGLLALMGKFDAYFGLRVSYALFSVTEELAIALQAKDITAGTALKASEAVINHLQRMRSDDHFDDLFDRAVSDSEELVEPPQLPRSVARNRRMPRRYDEGAQPHEWPDARAYYRHLYIDAIDVTCNELKNRFDQETLRLLREMEILLVNSANGETCEISDRLRNFYSDDIDFVRLPIQLAMLPDVLKGYNLENPSTRIKEITSVRSIADILQASRIASMFSQVSKLIQLYFTVPMSNATSERSFSPLRTLKNYLRSTMTQKRLNHLLFLSVHKTLADSADVSEVLSEFIQANDRRRDFFGVWNPRVLS